jgi:hypothetical protein
VGAPHSVRKKLLYMSTLFTKKSASLAAGVSAFVFALALVVPSASFAAGPSTLYVDPTASAVGQDGSSAHPFILIQDAVTAASAGDTIHISGKNTVTSKININVPLTITGYPSAEIDTTGSDYMFVINPGAAGTTISNLTLYKVDSVTDDAMVFVNANNVSITSNFIRGMYMIGDPNTSRGLVIANGVSGLYIFNNTFNSLRQPAYINNASGTVYHNTTQVTKGWVVVSESNITFTDNSWGTGPLANVVDIAIIPDSPAGANNYADVHAISLANHNAFVVNKAGATTQQSDVYVNDATGNDANDGSNLSPLKTIPAGLTRVVANGTVHVAAGTYAGPLTLTKSGVSLLGTAGVTVNETSNDSFGYGTTVDNASNVTISNITFVSAQTAGYAFHAFKADNLALNTVNFTGPGKTAAHIGGVDINTSNNVTLNGVSSTGFYKNGISVTGQYLASDTAANGITFNNVSSTNNGWSGISFYTIGNDHSPASIGGSHSITGVTFTGTNTIGGNSLLGLHLQGDTDANEGVHNTPANTVTTDGTTLDITHVNFTGNGIYDIDNYQTAPVNAIGSSFGGLKGDDMIASQRNYENAFIYDQLDRPAFGLVSFFTPAPSTVTVTIDAYVNGAEATNATTAGIAFPMHAVFPGGEGDYALSTVGYNNPDAYKATTSEMPTGSNYSTYQTDAATANQCTAAYPFRLVGYGTGATLADAAAATLTKTAPSFTNLTLSQFVIVYTKTCPPAPTAITPSASGTTVTNAQLPAITWSSVSDSLGPVASYNYEVSLSATTGAFGAFTAPIYGPVSFTSPSNPNGGTGDGTYYWHEQAVDVAGHPGPWSAPMSITFDGTAPSTPVLTAPANGTTLPTNEFDFTWNASSDASAVTYEFQSSLDSAQTGGVLTNGLWQSGVLTSPMIHSSGAPDGTWYWQVRAKDAAGNYSAWSPIWSVTLDHTPVVIVPPATASVTTNDASNVSAADATLNATNGGVDADGHSIWVSTSSFSTASPTIPAGVYSTPDMGAVTAGASYSATLSSVTTDGVPSNLPALVPGTTYYYAAWVHANGAWIPGDIKTVTLTSSGDTGGDTLAKPVGTFPDNAATLTSAQLTHVTWTAVSDAHAPISYVYEVSASPTVKGDGSFQTPIDIGAAGNVTTNEVATGGTPEGTYYWHVRAVDSLNTTSAWSDTESYTISNTVVVTNHAPTAGDQTLSLTQDTSAPITLNGADADNDNLTYAIVTAPTHGQVSGALPQATYTPDAGYTGTDSFVYSVTDGIVTVPPTGTVSITVNPAAPVNHVPAGADQSVSVDENSSAVITLSGTDADAADASHLTYTIVTTPAHGSFSGTAPALTYSPTTDYVGTDSFTYTVSDGVSTSSPSTVSITVNTVVAPTTQQSEVSNTRGSSGQFASPQGSAPANNGGVSGQVAGASTYFFAKNFGYNSRGQDVIELQKILIAAGLLHVNAPTGWFGSQTKAALKLWQTSQAISATGYVGPLTRAALNTLTGVSSTTTH